MREASAAGQIRHLDGLSEDGVYHRMRLVAKEQYVYF